MTVCGFPNCGEEARGSSAYCSENHRKRAWAIRNRPTCESCGAYMNERGRSAGNRLCAGCYATQRRTARSERAVRMAGMWRDGATQREIGESCGLSEKHVSVEFARLRKTNPDLLPYRRAPKVPR